MNYPVHINTQAYSSSSSDEYDALESNIPYTKKGEYGCYSPKLKKYNNIDINKLLSISLIFIFTLLIIVILVASISKISALNIVDGNDKSMIYTNFNEHETQQFENEHQRKLLYEIYEKDNSYLNHIDELNEGADYYTEYYKNNYLQICGICLQKKDK